MKKVFTIIIIVLSCCHINAQTLTGIVLDKATGQPIRDVYVYLDGTTFNVITNNSGRFELAVRNRINTKLVLYHVSYHTVILENPFEYLPEKIHMEERVNVLNELVVTADQFSRAQKLKAFREQFLGMTQAGRSCKIINESDIQIWYNTQSKTLSASSDQPITVINEYLGYEVMFNLIDFYAEYHVVTLNHNDVYRSYFAVTTSFTDINPNNRRVKRRRDEVYDRSSTFFFKNFANNTLVETGFRIYNNRLPIDHLLYFTTKDMLSYKIIQLIPDSGLKKASLFDDLQLATISVLYRHAQTDIHFYTDNILVDLYGNIDQIDKVIFSGRMGESRAGDMLPLEYEP
jgi:hypothetical protein